ncbi:MAG: hypothetical protein HKM89_01710 [Gemmatimonadales bacterium]|nr:hypothetical protein [Gemmatimonadales bacterium]
MVQSTDQETYRDAVRTVLHTHEIATVEIRITQILRLDLEGDGVEEVIVSSSNLDSLSPNAPRGGYSLVALRRVIADTVATFLLGEDYYSDGCTFCGPVVHRVAAVLDLTGDNVMEIITAFKHYEGEGKNIFSVAGSIPEKVLGWSCGV